MKIKYKKYKYEIYEYDGCTSDQSLYETTFNKLVNRGITWKHREEWSDRTREPIVCHARRTIHGACAQPGLFPSLSISSVDCYNCTLRVYHSPVFRANLHNQKLRPSI